MKNGFTHNPVMCFFNSLGEKSLGVIQSLGKILGFLVFSVVGIFAKKQFKNILLHIYYIGVRSISIVMLVGLFTGMVLGLQLYYTLVKFGSAGVLGSAIGLTLVRELGPVLTAIMVTARAGSAMTTEIGIQRITEQIDALFTMGVNPLRYLVSPRIAAAIISFPILTALFDIVGFLGGYITGVVLLGLDSGTYIYRLRSSIKLVDLNGGFIKAVVFALIVSTACCYNGFYTHLRRDSFGAKAVGLSTTTAVVVSCVWILISDYVVTSFLM
jgi:phospholipid/cholesterol/gamma-HCH transport system permease protein